MVFSGSPTPAVTCPVFSWRSQGLLLTQPQWFAASIASASAGLGLSAAKDAPPLVQFLHVAGAEEDYARTMYSDADCKPHRLLPLLRAGLRQS